MDRKCAGLVAAIAAILAGAGSGDGVASDSGDITGSSVLTGLPPTGLSIITREEIQASGHASLADLLRSSVFNSFGSYREQPGTVQGPVALLALRGLGAERTVILIDGLRVPGSPYTGSGSAADLNALPLHAVERIEILPAGASAIHGADAVGGVVNIVMRRDAGAEMGVHLGIPDRPGADALGGHLGLGGKTERGSYRFSAEWFERDPIFDGDRPYSRARFAPGDILGIDTVGVSQFGNTAFILAGPLAGAYRAVGDCPESAAFAGIFDYPPVEGDTACGFAPADVSTQTGGIKRLSSSLSAHYEITPDHDLYYRGMVSRVDSIRRFSPAADLFFIDADVETNPFGQPIYLLHRFVGHGPRDDNARSYQFDQVLGLDGALGGLSYDVYLRAFRSETVDLGTGYVLSSEIRDLVAAGAYDFRDPGAADNADAIAASRATLSRDLSQSQWQAGFRLGGFAGRLPAGDIAWTAALEYADARHLDRYDPYRSADNVIGAAGRSSGGERTRWAARAAVQVPLADTLHLELAARHDDYSDFGSEFSPSIHLHYRPTEWLALDAGWNRGFRAPTIRERTLAVTNLGRIHNLLPPPNDQFITILSGGNEALEAESTEEWRVGMTLRPLPDLELWADWFRVEIDDGIRFLDWPEIISLDTAGILPPGTDIFPDPSDPNNRILRTGFVNIAELKLEGWRLHLDHDADLGDAGMIRTSADYSRILRLGSLPSPIADETNLSGRQGMPSHQGSLRLDWALGDLAAGYAGHWIGDTWGSAGPGEGSQRGGSFIRHDVYAAWHAPWNARVQVGVHNLADKLPPVDPDAGWDPETGLALYPPDGRVVYLRYIQNL